MRTPPRRLTPRLTGFAAATWMLAATAATAVDRNDTKLLSEPALSATHVAFVYAGDLWVAPRSGGSATRRNRRRSRERRGKPEESKAS